jgi:hypothetical protein
MLPKKFWMELRRPMASQGVRSLLDVEVTPSSWKTGGDCRDSRPDSTHEPSQRFVGGAPHSRRTAQARDRSGSIDCGQISAPEPQAAIPELAAIVEESHERDGVDGLLYRADRVVPPKRGPRSKFEKRFRGTKRPGI